LPAAYVDAVFVLPITVWWLHFGGPCGKRKQKIRLLYYDLGKMLTINAAYFIAQPFSNYKYSATYTAKTQSLEKNYEMWIRAWLQLLSAIKLNKVH
jgi:hypothetical protein